jgi:hypothetical protein
MSNDKINGLRLPSLMMASIDDGTWDVKGKDWHAVFPAAEVQYPMFYSLDLMRRANATWLHETRSMFLGIENGIATPGILEPALSVLIGEIDSDSMIALDYRNVDQGPSVAFLNMDGQWVVVAENFNDFWRRLVTGA